ncbi:MAG: winged helix DNA-binding domain-containing protein [Polyangiaceae bacterium]
MTALQAQDFNGAKWAIGVRASGITNAHVDAAIASGKIVRAWPMRGTLHFTLAEDLGWITSLTRKRILQRATARRTAHGIGETDITRATNMFVRALEGNRCRTRIAMHELLGRAKLSDNQERGSHFLWHLSQTGLLCFGPPSGKSQTFVLAEEWIPRPRRLGAEEALAELTLRYFRGHGPATVKDFMWWSGLTLGEIKLGLTNAKARLAELRVDETPYFFDPNVLAAAPSKVAATYALPGFDEYLLGYRDRSAQLDDGLASVVVPGHNGVFKPMIVSGGRIVGAWGRLPDEKAVVVWSSLFGTKTTSPSPQLKRALAAYGKFYERPVRVTQEDA